MVFLYQITVFYNKNNSITFGTLFIDSMQTAYARGGAGGGGGSQQREIADGADVALIQGR